MNGKKASSQYKFSVVVVVWCWWRGNRTKKPLLNSGYLSNSVHPFVYKCQSQLQRNITFALLICSQTVSYKTVLEDFLQLEISGWLFPRLLTGSIKYL